MPLMLVVEVGDVIKIGPDIEIKYAKKLGRKAGIAIAAPYEIKIIRIPKEGIKKNESGTNKKSKGDT